MASYCFKPFKVPRVRVTLEDACGTPVTGDGSAEVTTDGIITIEQTATLQDIDDFFEKNGDGNFCIEEVDPEILKWYSYTLTFCNVDPELVYLLTRQGLLLDDAPTPVAIGNRSAEGDIKLVNFGFEFWTRLANQADCGSGVRFGYGLVPWMVQGKMSDVTYQNGTANFVVTSRSHRDALWGVGPYNVYESRATATLGQPMPLLSGMSVQPADHRLFFVTGLQPPVSACGIQALTLVLAAPVIAGQLVTITLPAATIPAFIDWGDGATTSNAAGPTAQHTYSGAGTRTIKVWPQDVSSQPYQVVVTT